MPPLAQVFFVVVGIFFTLLFGNYQLGKAIQNLEREPIGGKQKDYRVFKGFSKKKKDTN